MYLALTLVGNAIGVLLMVLGIWWGPIGIAVADVAATYLFAVPRLHYSFKGSPVTIRDFLGTIARPAAASLLMGVVLLLVQPATAALPRLVAFGVATAVAAVVFPCAWLLMPGGRADLGGLLEDLRSAIQRKRPAAAPVAAAAIVN